MQTTRRRLGLRTSGLAGEKVVHFRSDVSVLVFIRTSVGKEEEGEGKKKRFSYTISKRGMFDSLTVSNCRQTMKLGIKAVKPSDVFIIMVGSNKFVRTTQKKHNDRKTALNIESIRSGPKHKAPPPHPHHTLWEIFFILGLQWRSLAVIHSPPNTTDLQQAEYLALCLQPAPSLVLK